MLEHVDSLDSVIAETARVLVPGGLYLYGTINRTPVSRLVNTVIQDWEPTRFAKRGFMTRGCSSSLELRETMARHGLASGGTRGLRPRGGPIGLLRALRRRKRAG